MFDLKSIRERKHLSQEDIANKVGVTRGTVSKWEKGDIANMKRDKIAALANVLNISPLSILGLESKEPVIEPTSEYNFFNTGVAAGELSTVDPFYADDVESISLADTVMGRYAGDKDVFVTRINGESMNRVLPDESLIAIKQINGAQDLSDGDIVVFENREGMSVKRFFHDNNSNVLIFRPESTDPAFRDIVFRDESAGDVKFVGKVVVYVVEL